MENEDPKNEPTPQTDWWDELTDLEKAHIQEGLDDIENGRVVSSEEFWRSLNYPNQNSI